MRLKGEGRKNGCSAGQNELPADLSFRNADHEGHSSVRRAIQFDRTRDHLRSNLRDNQRFQTDAGHRAAPFGRGRMARILPPENSGATPAETSGSGPETDRCGAKNLFPGGARKSFASDPARPPPSVTAFARKHRADASKWRRGTPSPLRRAALNCREP